MNPERASLRALTLLCLRISNVTFGGGDPTMAVYEREMVHRRNWLAPDRYGLAYALARITPGTNVIAFTAGVAWMLRGWLGALLTVLVSTVPCAALVIWLTYAYERVKDLPLATAAITGMIASAAGMLFAAAWNLVRPHIRPKSWLRAVVFSVGSAALLLAFSISPILLLALAALVGYFWRGPEDA